MIKNDYYYSSDLEMQKVLVAFAFELQTPELFDWANKKMQAQYGVNLQNGEEGKFYIELPADHPYAGFTLLNCEENPFRIKLEENAAMTVLDMTSSAGNDDDE